MLSTLTRPDWVEILQNHEITNDLNLSIFQVLYAFENNAAPASEIGKILGFKSKSPQGPLNLEIGRYAKRIANHYEISFSERSNLKYKYWDLFFNGWNRGNRFVWQLKVELKEALEEAGLTGIERLAEEITDEGGGELLTEGLKKSIIINSYERNPQARQKCIDHWGAVCQVCDFDFHAKYGEIGRGFIHVHHLVPISEIAEEYEIDPIKDLLPVCPNCHAMIHRVNPPLRPDELQRAIQASTP